MRILKWSQAVILEMLKLHKHDSKVQVWVSDIMVVMSKHVIKDIKFSKSSKVDLFLLNSVWSWIKIFWKCLFYFY